MVPPLETISHFGRQVQLLMTEISGASQCLPSVMTTWFEDLPSCCAAPLVYLIDHEPQCFMTSIGLCRASLGLKAVLDPRAQWALR